MRLECAAVNRVCLLDAERFTELRDERVPRRAADRPGGIQSSCEERLDVLEIWRDLVDASQGGELIRNLGLFRSELRAKCSHVNARDV